jgi:ZIP family zinc transporter
MVFYVMLIFFGTALFQVLGALITWLSVKKFVKHHNLILSIEIIVMVLISAEIIFLGIRESLIPLYGVVAGMISILALNKFLPHRHMSESKRLGLLVFVAMCIHEFPEGIAFGSTYLLNNNIGVFVAALIAFHNLPEGSIAAMPFLLKNNVRKALALTIFTQVLYIMGGLIAFFFLVSLSTTIQAISACFAAGAMLFLAFEEFRFLK